MTHKSLLLDWNDTHSTSSQDISVLKVDFDKTDGSSYRNIINLIDLHGDFTTGEPAPLTNTLTGLHADLTLEGGSASAGSSDILGIDLNLDGHTNGNGTTNIGIKNVVAGADTNLGMYSKITDGFPDFKLYSSANSLDYCEISTTTNGATKLETVDGDSNLANLTFDVDGEAYFDLASSGNIYVQSAGTTTMEINNGQTGTGLIKMMSLLDTGDYCKLSTTTHGATTLATVDDDGNDDAHFILDVDGDITTDSATGDFIMKKAGTEFSSANSAYAGMILGYTRIQNDGTVSADNQITIGTAMTVLQTNHGTNAGVTFTVPPSGNVEIIFSCYLNVSNKIVDFALSSGTAFSEVADMHTYDAGSNYSVDSHREFVTIPFAVTGLTSGDELTYYIAASSSASSAYINHGNFRTTGLHYPPILVKAIALPTTITTGE